MAVAIANNLVTGFPPPQPASAIAAVTNADGLVTVTPAFSAPRRWSSSAVASL
ncbi:hypothetical protein [Streptomyces acidicola]|uniref:hypothetical protein n=1 Tax=Streptomyces acidicola TaxID=2596892 RepID=UPI00188446BB|nr:hypothetical protein [Streptomyces acidicola]